MSYMIKMNFEQRTKCSRRDAQQEQAIVHILFRDAKIYAKVDEIIAIRAKILDDVTPIIENAQGIDDLYRATPFAETETAPEPIVASKEMDSRRSMYSNPASLPWLIMKRFH